ncbi:BGTF surface domain-containing protein [Halopiger thermotolerans]
MSGNSYRKKGRAVFLAAIMVLSVVAMSVAFAGAGAADDPSQPDSIGDAGPTYNHGSTGELNNEDVWIGQEVTLQVEDKSFTSLQIRQGSTYNSDDSVVIENRVDNDADEVTFDSSKLEAGNPYNLYLTGANSSWDKKVFWVESENLNTEFTSSTVTQEGSVNVSLESDRANQWVNVSADGIDDGDLAGIFSDADSNIDSVKNPDEDDGVVTLNVTGVPSDDSVEFGADFSEIDAGEYEFDFETTDSLAADNATIEVIQDDAEVSFEGDANGEQGEIIDITVSTKYVDSGAVQIGDVEDDNFQAATEFEINEDDLNQITLQFNTNAPNNTGAKDAWSLHPKHEDHDIELSNKAVNASALDQYEPLGAYEYEMEAGTDLNTSSKLDSTDNYYINDADVTDTAFFNVNEPSPVGDVSTQVAPAGDSIEGFDNFNDTTVTNSDVVADGDHLLLNLKSFDQSGLVDSWSNGDSVGEDLGNQSINITVEEQDPGPNVDAQVWSTNPDQVGSDADHLIHANVTYTDVSEYNGNLVLALNYEKAGLEAGESYDLTYSVSENSPYVDSEDEEIEIEDSFTVEEPELEWDSSAEEVPNSENAEVTGTTNVAPGSEINTNARSSGNFTDSEEAIVAEDGTFTATYDFSEYDAGINFDLTATHAERSTEFSDYKDALQDKIEATLVEAGQPNFSLETSAPEEVKVGADATLDVTVTNTGDTEGEVPIGVEIGGETVTDENATLGAGEEWSESFSFNTSEAGDIEWGVTAGDESASGTLTVAEEKKDDSGTDDSGSEDSGSSDSGSEDSGSSDSGSEDSGSEDSGSEDSGSDGTPGFGVAVATIALLAAAMLALRRQD